MRGVTPRFSQLSLGGGSIAKRVHVPHRGAVSGLGSARQHEVRLASSTSATDGNDSRDARREILEAALTHVNRKGWTKEALAAGAADVNLPAVTHGLFKRGAAELAEFLLEEGNKELQQFLATETSPEMSGLQSGEELVAAALFHRLRYTVPYLRSWPQAMALGLHPENVSFTTQKLHEIPAQICAAANQVDGSNVWDARVTAVGGIYAASELYMLTDYSESFQDTSAFVKSRLRDSLQVEQQVPLDTVLAAVSGLGSLAQSAATMVAPLVPKPSMVPLQMLNQLGAQVQNGMATVEQNVSSSARKEDKPTAPPTTSPTTPPAPSAPAPPATNKSTSSTPASNLDDLPENETMDASLDVVQLPAGLSLFGLMSMNGEEARKIVQTSNPDFTVLVTPFSDADAQPVLDRRLVRLLVDEAGLVVDVLRS